MTGLAAAPRQSRASETVNVLGVAISAIDMGAALATISDWIERREKQYVCVCTVHTVMECRRSPHLQRVVNEAGLNTPDGVPLVWLARLAGKRDVRRVYGPDLMLAEMASSNRNGHRHFLYGGMPGIADRLSASLRHRFPGNRIVGSLTPPVGPISELCTPDAAARINEAKPDIVWVGLSTPKQEEWMARMRPMLDASVLIGVGAAFDFHSGAVRQAPNWVQMAGMEWAFRLVQEPRRLWRRYLFDNPRFLAEIALQKSRLRRYDLV